MIHLVKRPPPSLAGPQGDGVSAEGQSSAPPRTGAGPGPPPGMTVQATQDVVIMGNIPVSSHSDITQVTQVCSLEPELSEVVMSVFVC